MAIQSQLRRSDIYVGDGVQTQFSFSFKLLKSEDAEVHVAPPHGVDAVLNPNAYVCVLNDDQDVNPGGKITLKEPLVKGAALAVISGEAYVQPTVFTNRGAFFPTVLNDSLDRLTILCQQLVEQVSRALITDPTDTITPRQLRDKLLAAVDDAIAAAGASKETLAACEAIKGLIERYSWDIPHLVNSLEEVEAYPYDGYFWVKGYGNPGNAGEDISNRLVGGETLGKLFKTISRSLQNVRVEAGVVDGHGISIPSFCLIGLAPDFDVGEKPLASVISVGQNLQKTLSSTGKLSSCIAIGDGVMSEGVVTGAHNIGIGLFALHNLTAGERNTAIGSLALFATTTGKYNTALGRDAAQCVTTGANNTAIGYRAMSGYAPVEEDNIIRLQLETTANNNTVLGFDAGARLATGSANTIIGAKAGVNCKTTSRSVVIGYRALADAQENVSINGIKTRAIGTDCHYSAASGMLTVTLANHGIAAGALVGITYKSGAVTQVTSDPQWLYVKEATTDTLKFEWKANYESSGTCTVDFAETGDKAKESDANVVLGNEAAVSAVRCRRSTIIGAYSAARDSGVDSNETTLVGGYAAMLAATLNQSVVIGNSTAPAAASIASTVINGYGCFAKSTTILDATAIGYRCALNALSNASDTFIGFASGSAITGASSGNTAVGHNAMRFMQDGNTIADLSESTALGHNARVSGGSQIQLGASGTTVYAYGAVQDRSDRRDKADIRDTILGSDFILSLRPVDFRWDYRDDYFDEVSDGEDEDGNPKTKLVPVTKDGSRKRKRYHHGLIAQEVKATMEKLGVDFGGYQDHSINGGCDVLSLGYEELIGPMIKTIQELNARIKTLEAKVL